MSNHTPGPWVARKTRVVIHGRTGFNGGEYRVADAYSSSAGLANTPSFSEAEANAKLIAAAFDYDTVAREMASFRDAGKQVPQRVWQKLYDAIAKAATA